MGSILISDVGHHFSYTMLGTNPHQHQPREAPTGSAYSMAVPSRPSQPAPGHEFPRASTGKDTSMPDVLSSPGLPEAPDHPSRRYSGDNAPTGDVSSRILSAVPADNSARLAQSPRYPGTVKPSSQHQGHGAQFQARPPGIESSSSTSARPSPSRSVRSTAYSEGASPSRIKVLSLSHIQSFATDHSSPFSLSRSDSRRSRRGPGDVGPQYEISEMPVTDIIEMVAGLLTKITTTNDRQHEHLHRQIPPSETGSGMSQQTASVLAFHGKNIPSITILSYLSRIHKYCPTTYEVFLSLLVYFDRMTERVNSGPMKSMRQASSQAREKRQPRRSRDSSPGSSSSSSSQVERSSPTPTPSSYVQQRTAPSPITSSVGNIDSVAIKDEPVPPPSLPLEISQEGDPYNLSHFFVVDSFNIHRLVIAGVTCASKFFSDVFYTNSRYAKVGGLPLAELNHLELQFLLLNDFRLSIPIEEMEAYGTMLVEFYAREVVAQQKIQSAVGGPRGGGSASQRSIAY